MTLGAEEEEIPCGTSTSIDRDGKEVAMEILDEYWFFHNILNGTRMLPLHVSCKNYVGELITWDPIQEGKEVSTEKLPRDDHIAIPNLLRIPSLPPRIGQEETTQEDAGSCKFSSPRLRHSYSSLGNHHHHSSLKYARPNTIIPRHKPPRGIKVEGMNIKYCRNQHYMIEEAACTKAFQERKWKSLSDLEFEEVQGFKDLGFVFDKEGLNPRIVKVIPGLNNKRPTEVANEITRPYLSEAWLVQRSAPPVLNWVDRRSATNMKQQLKFWARIVACNVRQEC